VIAASAPAKLNLALVVGPRGDDGKHEVVTLMAALELADAITLEPADELSVKGFPDDTLVHRSLRALASAARTEPNWRVTIEKRIPVAAGLGGGSSDAAVALVLANGTLPEPLSSRRLHDVAAAIGADVPFFLTPGAKLARGDGTTLEPIELGRNFDVLLLLPEGASKSSTADVYRAFDEGGGEHGFDERVARLEAALQNRDLAGLPRNDLVSSPHAGTLSELGAFRADVTGAGPVVYGLFGNRTQAEEAALALATVGRIWLTKSAW
jgi:4-diphosphocytidyl-2-C-methyl-D-erythritol kinase